MATTLSLGFKSYASDHEGCLVSRGAGGRRKRLVGLDAPYLDHEIVTEAPARLRPLLPQGPHVVLKLAQVFGKRHKKGCPEFGQEGIPGFLSSRRVLQGVGEHNTPAETRMDGLENALRAQHAAQLLSAPASSFVNWWRPSGRRRETGLGKGFTRNWLNATRAAGAAEPWRQAGVCDVCLRSSLRGSLESEVAASSQASIALPPAQTSPVPDTAHEGCQALTRPGSPARSHYSWPSPPNVSSSTLNSSSTFPLTLPNPAWPTHVLPEPLHCCPVIALPPR